MHEMNSPYYFGGLLGSAEGFLGWADDLAEKRKILLTWAAPILMSDTFTAVESALPTVGGS